MGLTLPIQGGDWAASDKRQDLEPGHKMKSKDSCWWCNPGDPKNGQKHVLSPWLRKPGAGGEGKKLVLDLEEQRPRSTSAASAENGGPYLVWELLGGVSVRWHAWNKWASTRWISSVVLSPGPSWGQSYVLFVSASLVPSTVPDTGQMLINWRMN